MSDLPASNPPKPQRQHFMLDRYGQPTDIPAPPPPPMRVVTKGWWVLREEEKTLEELQQEDRREQERKRQGNLLQRAFSTKR